MAKDSTSNGVFSRIFVIPSREQLEEFPLYQAIYDADFKKVLSVIQDVQDGDEPEFVNQRIQWRGEIFTPLRCLLCLASDDKGKQVFSEENTYGIAMALLENDADPDTVIQEGRGTALHLGVKRKWPDFVGLFLGHKADPQASSIFGTPLALALEMPANKVVKVLLDHGANPLVVAANEGSFPSFWYSVVPWFICNNKDDAVENIKLLKARDVDFFYSHNGTNLINFLISGLSLRGCIYIEDVSKKWKEFVALIGADVNTPDKDGDYPIHVAILGGNINNVKAVLDLGGDIKARNSRTKEFVLDCASRHYRANKTAEMFIFVFETVLEKYRHLKDSEDKDLLGCLLTPEFSALYRTLKTPRNVDPQRPKPVPVARHKAEEVDIEKEKKRVEVLKKVWLEASKTLLDFLQDEEGKQIFVTSFNDEKAEVIYSLRPDCCDCIRIKIIGWLADVQPRSDEQAFLSKLSNEMNNRGQSKKKPLTPQQKKEKGAPEFDIFVLDSIIEASLKKYFQFSVVEETWLNDLETSTAQDKPVIESSVNTDNEKPILKLLSTCRWSISNFLVIAQAIAKDGDGLKKIISDVQADIKKEVVLALAPQEKEKKKKDKELVRDEDVFTPEHALGVVKSLLGAESPLTHPYEIAAMAKAVMVLLEKRPERFSSGAAFLGRALSHAQCEIEDDNFKNSLKETGQFLLDNITPNDVSIDCKKLKITEYLGNIKAEPSPSPCHEVLAAIKVTGVLLSIASDVLGKQNKVEHKYLFASSFVSAPTK